jgi:predicted dehydrogenase
MTERIYNVAVIGYGLSSQVFKIPFLSSQLKLHAIAQRNPINENGARRDHPYVKMYRGCDEMLKDKAVDLVVVATPPPTHFTLCKEALESGKHGTLVSRLSRIF